MYLPTLGKYPLSLRPKETSSTRLGELLCDYTDDKLYYIDLKSGELVEIAESIHTAITKLKVEKSKIQAVKEQQYVTSDVPVIPTVDKRECNKWYFNIYNAV